MEEIGISEIKNAVSKLERQNRRLSWGFNLMLILLPAIVLTSFFIQKTNAGTEITPDSILRVRGLVIVDKNGTERVQIGAPLPDPLALGKRHKRQGAVSGILLMDAEGNERSGYATADATGEIFLTLDNVGEQTAMFYANPDTGSQLYVRDSDNGNFIQLNATGKNPSIKMLRQGKTIFQMPEAGGDK
jgi:hypothetical protein